MHKSVNIHFLSAFKVLLKFQESLYGKTSRAVSWNVRFCFCLNVHELDDSFTFIWKKKILCHIVLFLCDILSYGSSGFNCKFILRKYGFLINSKISFINPDDKHFKNLSHKFFQISIFCRF